jgi:hypothetical protein
MKETSSSVFGGCSIEEAQHMAKSCFENAGCTTLESTDGVTREQRTSIINEFKSPPLSNQVSFLHSLSAVEGPSPRTGPQHGLVVTQAVIAG